jgi:cytoskeletal protein CcmA (bactofilin family)
MLDTFRKRDHRRDHLPQPGAGLACGRAVPVSTADPNEAVIPPEKEAQQPKFVLPPHAVAEPSRAAASLPRSPSHSPLAANVPGSAARLIVGPDIKLKGAEISDCDTLIVEGLVEACMRSRVVEVTEHGTFRGKVEVDVAEIRGRFEGELTVHKQLMVRSSGRIAGKIRYGKILIDEGGELAGDVVPADANGTDVSSRINVNSPVERSSDAATEYLPRGAGYVEAIANRVSSGRLRP